MRLRLRKTSLLDYPGKLAAVCFVRGCNLRCPWCHNPELVLPPGREEPGTVEEEGLSPAEVLAFLEKRRAVLGGLVISGGEPCLWGELPDFIGAVKKTGLRVKIDTNGTVPAMLEGLLRRGESRPDYLALDLKLAPARYGELLPPGGGEGGAGGPGAALEKSAALLRASGIAHEFRSIALPESFFTEHDVEALAPLVGGAPWYFRAFRGGNCLDPAWNGLEGGGAGAKILARKARDLGKNASTP